jgi:hypothetical protein
VTTTSSRKTPLRLGLANNAKAGPKRFNGDKEWLALLDHDWIPDAKNVSDGTAALTKQVMDSKRPVLIPIVLKPRNSTRDCPPPESGYSKEPKYTEQQLGILRTAASNDSLQEWACELKESELAKALNYFYPRGQSLNPWRDSWGSILNKSNSSTTPMPGGPGESSVVEEDEDEPKIDSKTVLPGGGGPKGSASTPGQNAGNSAGRGGR